MKYLIANQKAEFIAADTRDLWTNVFAVEDAFRFESEDDAKDYIAETATYLADANTEFEVIAEIEHDGVKSHRSI
mgnify:CR=1 FL=1